MKRETEFILNCKPRKPSQDTLILLQIQLWKLLLGWKHFHFWKISIYHCDILASSVAGITVPRKQSRPCSCANNGKQWKWCKAMLEHVPSPSWRLEWQFARLNHFFLINDSILIKPNHSSIAPYTAVKLLPAYWWSCLRKVIGLVFIGIIRDFHPSLTCSFLHHRTLGCAKCQINYCWGHCLKGKKSQTEEEVRCNKHF